MFINFWLIGNFLYFYCYKTDGSSELEQFKGLDEIELDIVRKSVMQNRGTQSMYSMKGNVGNH